MKGLSLAQCAIIILMWMKIIPLTTAMTTTPFKIGLGEIEVVRLDNISKILSLVINLKLETDKENDRTISRFVKHAIHYLVLEGFLPPTIYEDDEWEFALGGITHK
jgi:hypothetical protein